MERRAKERNCFTLLTKQKDLLPLLEKALKDLEDLKGLKLEEPFTYFFLIRRKGK